MTMHEREGQAGLPADMETAPEASRLQEAAEAMPAEVAPGAPKAVGAGEGIRLERKHLLAIRWMHWVNFPVLFTMIWSGLLIYWNDSDNAYRYAHRVYRVGVGGWTLFRFFPDWVYRAVACAVPRDAGDGVPLLFYVDLCAERGGVGVVHGHLR